MTQAQKSTIYGIRQCDTMKKARLWLDQHHIDYAFHDYKLLGIDQATLRNWCAVLGWEMVINRSGTTFRRMPETERNNLSETLALQWMVLQPSMIKRPVLAHQGKLILGFKAEQYQQFFI